MKPPSNSHKRPKQDRRTKPSTSHKRAKPNQPNWLDLQSGVTANILARLGTVDVLKNAQRVCTAWSKVCKDPALWRVVALPEIRAVAYNRSVYDGMCRRAVDLSQGQLVDICVRHGCTPSLLTYIADRSSQLRRLEIVSCGDSVYEVMPSAFGKFPLLEELIIEFTEISKEAIEAAGRCCPQLKTFKLNNNVRNSSDSDNEKATAIGQNMHGLCQLQLIGSFLTDVGLKLILDGCPNLESLDMRCCRNINFSGDLRERCCESIKCLKYPDDSLEGYQYKIDYDDFDNSTDSDWGCPCDCGYFDSGDGGSGSGDPAYTEYLRDIGAIF